jgi:hypothetical protein
LAAASSAATGGSGIAAGETGGDPAGLIAADTSGIIDLQILKNFWRPIDRYGKKNMRG